MGTIDGKNMCLKQENNMNDKFIIPQKSKEDPNYIEHVVCEGSRQHVIHWEKRGEHAVQICSEKNCIINKGLE